MRRSIAVFITLSVMCSLCTTVSIGAATAVAIPSCVPKHVAVVVGKWVHDPSTVDTVFESLPISFVNEGATCVIGGYPKIAPTGIKAKSFTRAKAAQILVPIVTITSTTYQNLTLEHGAAAHSFLNLVYPIDNVSVVDRWKKLCRPEEATGFTINIVPAKHLLNRHVLTRIPNVCTSGKTGDLRTGPLTASSA